MSPKYFSYYFYLFENVFSVYLAIFLTQPDSLFFFFNVGI